MRRTKRTTAHDSARLVAVLLVAAGCVLALAACGSSSNPSSASSSSSNESAGIRYADCMRSHGVSNFPDPGGGGGGIKIPIGSAQAPAFQSAQSACSKLMPGPGPLKGPASESRKLAMLKLAQCMRAHGLTTFPDPTSTPPSPSAGIGLAFGGGGSFIAVPQSIMQSPAFKQAAAECSFPGGGGRGKPSIAIP